MIVGAGCAIVIGGCSLPGGSAWTDRAEPSSTSSVSASLAPSTDVAQARAQLDALVGAARLTPSEAGYRRDAFGSAWADIDGNGCNQRDDVLLRDAVPDSTRVGVQGRCDHDVLAGTWVDPYTGRRHVLDDLKDRSQAQAVQIDHIVPLAEAWVSGAAAWSDDQRRAYANDVGVLLAVDGATNASKGAADPAAWRPRKGYQCTYAVRWIAIKTTWMLSVDPSERAALGAMLTFC